MKTKCRVIGKVIKSGWIFDSYFIKLLDLENNIEVKFDIDVQKFNDLKIGDIILVNNAFWLQHL